MDSERLSLKIQTILFTFKFLIYTFNFQFSIFNCFKTLCLFIRILELLIEYVFPLLIGLYSSQQDIVIFHN